MSPRTSPQHWLANASTGWAGAYETGDVSERDVIGFAPDGYAPETRAFTPEEEEVLRGGGGGYTNSGIWVGEADALRVSAAFACRRVIAEDVAKMPISVVRETTDAAGISSQHVCSDHPVHRLFNEHPNDWMTPFEYIEYMVGVATMHPTSYSLVQRDQFGRVVELLPLLPGTAVEEVDTYWDVRYRVTGYGLNLLLEPSQIFRLNGPMKTPWRGYSIAGEAREAVGLAAAIEASQARFHRNDMRPAGVLTSDSQIDAKQRENIREAWKAAYGPDGTGGVAVLDSAFKFQTMVAEGAKSEVIDNRKHQVNEICRFFRVLPIVIGHNDGSQTFAAAETFFTAHAQMTLHPWVKRFEQAATMALLTPQERAEGMRVDLDMDDIMRGTPGERMSYYEKAVKFFMTPNEARVREGYAPLPFDEMNRPQLPANNTGLAPSSGPSKPGGSLTPVKPLGLPSPKDPAPADATRARTWISKIFRQ